MNTKYMAPNQDRQPADQNLEPNSKNMIPSIQSMSSNFDLICLDVESRSGKALYTVKTNIPAVCQEAQ
jgi:hypothetical protein